MIYLLLLISIYSVTSYIVPNTAEEHLHVHSDEKYYIKNNIGEFGSIILICVLIFYLIYAFFIIFIGPNAKLFKPVRL